MLLSQRQFLIYFAMSEHHSKALVMLFALCCDLLFPIFDFRALCNEELHIFGSLNHPAIYHRLTLLWYHTIVRPFFALDGSKVRAGVEAAHLLLQEAQQNYSQSALFLFFRGRVHRLQVGQSANKIAEYLVALLHCFSTKHPPQKKGEKIDCREPCLLQLQSLSGQEYVLAS